MVKLVAIGYVTPTLQCLRVIVNVLGVSVNT